MMFDFREINGESTKNVSIGTIHYQNGMEYFNHFYALFDKFIFAMFIGDISTSCTLSNIAIDNNT